MSAITNSTIIFNVVLLLFPLPFEYGHIITFYMYRKNAYVHLVLEKFIIRLRT